MKTFKFNNPNASATVRQRIYLHFLTGKDTKNTKMTVKQAAELIDKAKNKTFTVKINGKIHKAIIVS